MNIVKNLGRVAGKQVRPLLGAGFNFHSAQAYSKKLGIGEATVALEEKISKISQLVFYRFWFP